MRQTKTREPAIGMRRRARHGLRPVIAFQDRLRELDRALDRELRRPTADRGGAPSVLAAAGEAVTGWSRLGEIVSFLERFERLRGSERADDFGLDPEFEDWIAPLFVFLYRRWWRVEARGLENVPAASGAMVVANHAGAMFPYDGAMLKVALRLEHPAKRELRPLIDDFVFRLPFFASFMARIGGARACPENAERLLRRGEIVGIFPEGVRGMKKSFRQRYRVQRFGRGGFVTLAVKTRVPIVPVAIVGAEEIHPLLGTLQWPAKLLGVPYVPLTPTFPWLGPLGLIPLPSKWIIRCGEPIDLAARYEPDCAEDPVLVDRITEEVRQTVQSLVDGAVRERGPAFF
ncbi:MAG: lysophospholipid acyltransferase family protein [Candidatus Binatia bacterium]